MNLMKITGLATVITAVFMGPFNHLALANTDPPPLAPLGEPPIPPDNKQTDAKVELGKILFFDPRIGGDTSTACATCHEPDQGWAWSDDFSRGYPGTVHWRNSQSIVNSVYYGKFFWAGAAQSLEKQAPSAAKGGVAGNGENDLMEARLCLIPEYRKRFKEVFGDEWPLIGNAWRAIAAFERTLVQRDTPLDKYLQGEEDALTEPQKRGMTLFNGKAGCINCHNGPFATDQRFYNIGVPYAKRWEEDGLAQITFRFEYYAKGAQEALYRTAKADVGLYFRTKNEWDKGKFRTPTLRYTLYTAPYMHNGAFYTLAEVVDFYNRGGFAASDDEDEEDDDEADDEGDDEADDEGDDDEGDDDDDSEGDDESDDEGDDGEADDDDDSEGDDEDDEGEADESDEEEGDDSEADDEGDDSEADDDEGDDSEADDEGDDGEADDDEGDDSEADDGEADDEGDAEGEADDEGDTEGETLKVGRTTDWPQNKTPLIKPLGLTKAEKEDLVAFIEAFSGEAITIERPKLPNYAPLFTEEELQALKK